MSKLTGVSVAPRFTIGLKTTCKSALGPNSQIAISQSRHAVSHVIAQSLVTKLVSINIGIRGLRTATVPITHAILMRVNMTKNVRIHLRPSQPSRILVRFFSRRNVSVPGNGRGGVRNTCFGRSLHHSTVRRVNAIACPDRIIPACAATFRGRLGMRTIAGDGTGIIVSCICTISKTILPRVLNGFSYSTIILGTDLHRSTVSASRHRIVLDRLNRIIRTLQTAFKTRMSTGNRRLVLISRINSRVQNRLLATLVTRVVLASRPENAVIIPIRTSNTIRCVTHHRSNRIVHAGTGPATLVRTYRSGPGIVLNNDNSVNFVFPRLRPNFSTVFYVTGLVRVLALRSHSLNRLLARLPQIYRHATALHYP